MTRQIADNLYEVKLSVANVFLIDDPDGLILIDTGNAGEWPLIRNAIERIGQQAESLRHVIVTHCHPDHAGSLAAIQRDLDVTTYMHADDAQMVREGKSLRPTFSPPPGLHNRLLFWWFVSGASAEIEPATVDREVNDVEQLPIAGGMRFLHAPGHSAGQIVVLWQQHGGVLFAGDTAVNAYDQLRVSPAYEDYALGQKTLKRIAGEDFQVACFGHGNSIRQSAAQQFNKFA